MNFLRALGATAAGVIAVATLPVTGPISAIVFGVAAGATAATGVLGIQALVPASIAYFGDFKPHLSKRYINIFVTAEEMRRHSGQAQNVREQEQQNSRIKDIRTIDGRIQNDEGELKKLVSQRDEVNSELKEIKSNLKVKEQNCKGLQAEYTEENEKAKRIKNCRQKEKRIKDQNTNELKELKRREQQMPLAGNVPRESFMLSPSTANIAHHVFRQTESQKKINVEHERVLNTEDTVRDRNNSKAELQQDISKLERKISDQEQAIFRYYEEESRLQSTLTAKRAEIEECQKQIEALRDQKRMKEKECEQCNTAIEALHDQLATQYNNQLTSLKKEIDEFRSTHQTVYGYSLYDCEHTHGYKCCIEQLNNLKQKQKEYMEKTANQRKNF